MKDDVHKGENMKKNTSFTYPSEPPKPIEKPEFRRFKEGEKRPIPPKNSLWGSHDPAIYKDPTTGNYYIYCTGGMCLRSTDLITWERIGRVVSEPPKESSEWVGGKAIWAPDIVKVNDEYRLYCSNSSWGVRQSCIFLATSKSPEGPFEPVAPVIKTNEPKSPCNAIDANIISDEKTGEMYMVYGSFWGGCYLLKLDPKTGLAAEDGYGRCIAKRPKWTDGAIEGPYIRYNKETGYYYLFVSYGSLNSDYNIRVGRSKSLTGPYLDHNGRNMTDLNDYNNTVGYMIAAGYQFDNHIGYMGPGHNSVLCDDDGSWYLICHIRERNFKTPEISTMHCYQMLWTEEGWPVIIPERYSGEKQGSVKPSNIVGHYEYIKLNPTVPQGVISSLPLHIKKNGSFDLSSIHGTWKLIDDSTIQLSYGPYTELLQVSPAWDYENWNPTTVFTGYDQNHICVWCKKWPKEPEFPKK